jgi:hypothetical protein
MAIKIKKSKIGSFTDWCKKQGFDGVTKKCIAKGKKSKDKRIAKKATFADNAKKWDHD